MASVNKVILVGNLGGDPVVRTTGSGNKVANFSLATTERWKDSNGNQKEETEWHNITAWNNFASLSERYLGKGLPVYIEGKLHTSSWEQNGERKIKTEVVVTSMQLLGRKENREEKQEEF